METKSSIIAHWLCLLTMLTTAFGHVALSENKQGSRLGSDEIQGLAVRVTQIQIAYNELTSLRQQLAQDSVGVSDGSGNPQSPMLIYRGLLPPEEVPVGAVLLRDSIAESYGFEVWKCYRKLAHDSPRFILAFGYDGSLFLLNGFDTNDFVKLVKYKVRIIHSKDIALWLARLYMNTVEGGYRIVESKGDQSGGRVNEMDAPSCTRSKTGFVVRLWVERGEGLEQKSYIRHEIRISKEGQITHKTVLSR